MNMKKVLTVVLASAMVAATTGVVASAATLGQSEDTFVAQADKNTDGTVFLDNDAALSFSIPANTLEDGVEVIFEAVSNADAEGTFSAKLKDLGVTYDNYFVLDINFVDAAGEKLDLTNIPLVLSNADFNAVYVEEADGSLKNLEMAADGSFVAPHFSNYVFVKTTGTTPVDPSQPADPSSQPAQPSTPSDPSGVSTGDNALTTAAVIGAVALVSLGTVVAVTKKKKSE